MLILILKWVFIVSIVVAVCCLAKDEWRSKGKWLLCWALFPYSLIVRPRRLGIVKNRAVFLVSPFMLYLYFLVFAFILYDVAMKNYYVPKSIPYHTAEDLKKATGVEFPEVVAVDSTLFDDPGIGMWFVMKEDLRQAFFQRLDRACKDDTCCWHRDSLGYRYCIVNPERPIDRTQGTHTRKKAENEEDDIWIDRLEVVVPLNNDTIYVYEGTIWKGSEVIGDIQ